MPTSKFQLLQLLKILHNLNTHNLIILVRNFYKGNYGLQNVTENYMKLFQIEIFIDFSSLKSLFKFGILKIAKIYRKWELRAGTMHPHRSHHRLPQL